MSAKKIVASALVIVVVALFVIVILSKNFGTTPSVNKELSHELKWGIYSLNLETEETELLYSSPSKISRIRLSNGGGQLVFSQPFNDNNGACEVEGVPVNVCEEICVVGVDGEGFRRLTDNEFGDLVPCWSSDDSEIFFLSFRETMDIFRVDADGSNIVELYDSGFQDSDLHCSDGKIVFTRNSQIWMMNEDGTAATQVTDSPRAGEKGNAVLPFGDYDPNLSPSGDRIVFERLVRDETVHGNYDIYVVNSDGSGETAITTNGYTQGLPVWSHSGQKIVYIVSAIGTEGKYDIYLMNADGSENRNITPTYFPADFLCHDPIFSNDDSKILFIGEWYND